jgi:hypothetical protein
VEANEKALRFRNQLGTITVRLKPSENGSDLSIIKQDDKKAKQDGVLPEPSKGRLILANAHHKAVTFAIGKTNYPVGAGAGADHFKDALNYTVKPGKFIITIKIPGQPAKQETIQIASDAAWGVIAVPTGGYMVMQLY